MHQLIQSKAKNMAKYRLSLNISKSMLPRCVHANGGPEGNSCEGNYMPELLYVFIYHGKFTTYLLVFKQWSFQDKAWALQW